MFEYLPKTVPQKIYVIGGGGTGGRVIPLLAQFLKTVDWVIKPEIVIVDDDTVEQKNLKRQNFISTDVGKPKAVVLAERYSRAFDIKITPDVRRITADKPLFEGWNFPRNLMFILCVDSAKARRDILMNLKYLNGSAADTLFIDSGNEDSYGQVTIFNPRVLRASRSADEEMKNMPELLPVRGKLEYMPMDWKFYKDMEDVPNTRSCADLDQTLAINAMMATTIMGVVQNYYYNKPFTYNRLFVGLNGSAPANILDYRNLKAIETNAAGGYYDKSPDTQFFNSIGAHLFDMARPVNDLRTKYWDHLQKQKETVEEPLPVPVLD